MYYIIYKTTNQIDSKFYIGAHRTKNLDDNYMGSGKYLKRAIEKYGIENFKKEILFIFDNPKEMYEKEAEIVNEDFLATENTYNLKKGGRGGWDHICNDSDKQRELCIRGNIKQKWLLENDPTWMGYARKCATGSKNLKSAHERGLIKYNTFSGKKHKEETKIKIGQKNSEKQKGNKNSQYGTMWITNNIENKKIKKDDSIPSGWHLGRKFIMKR